MTFYPRFAWNFVVKHVKLIGIVWWILAIKWRIERDPNRLAYTDRALTPVHDDDEEATLDLLTKTSGVREALDHQKKVAQLTGAAVARLPGALDALDAIATGWAGSCSCSCSR